MTRTFGIDVARTGEDKSVCFILDKEGKTYTAHPPIVWSKADLMESCGRIQQLYNRWQPSQIIIDADGLGAGVFDRLRELELPVFAFHGSGRTDQMDATGENGFLNLRSWAWWNMRSLLEPANGFTVRLPKNDDLVGDLCAPKWFIRSGSLIQIEAKEKIKQRLGRSPDLGDALCYAAADVDRSQFAQAYAVHQGTTVEKEILPEIRPKRTEAEMLEAMLWKGASKSNHDVFDW
jgi:hypothetical protein